MELKNQDIKCSDYLDAKAAIGRAEAKAGEAKNGRERQYYAQDILLEAKTLLSCSDYKSGDSDCINCRSILRGYMQKYGHLAKEQRQGNAINK